MDKDSSSRYTTSSHRFAVYDGKDGKFELGIWCSKPIGAAVADFWMPDVTTEELAELADIIWDKLNLDGPTKGKPEEPKRETLTPIAMTPDDLRQIESNTLMNVVKLAQALAVKQWVDAKEDAA